MLAAVVQLTSVADRAQNLERAAHWIACAARAGAKLCALPENFSYMRAEAAAPHPGAEPLEGPSSQFLREQAKRHGIVLCGGSFPEAVSGQERVHNTSLVVSEAGEVLAIYRKIHLFDIDLPGTTLRESAAVAPGSELVVTETSAGCLGLSICYDVRFPELYRELVTRGAQILLVPSAFTVPTGRDHWEVLLRARAIENQCFVLAPAQHGRHSPQRESYGRSLIIDPWGTVLATAPDGEGIALAEIDLERMREIRRRLPALQHRRVRPASD
jgi:deaminated glutathione amidase